MEVNVELNVYQKIVDFVIENYPELKDSHLKLDLVGEEAPSTFIILVKEQDLKSTTSNIALVLYECQFNSETPKSNINLSFILRLRGKEEYGFVTKDGEDICYASLSDDRFLLGLSLSHSVDGELSYSCCILNISLISFSLELVRLHTIQSLEQLPKIQFIQTPTHIKRTSTKNNFLFKLQSTHILMSVKQNVIKYQRLVLSPNSAIIENENILSSKLHYHEMKSELERLYILERSAVGHFNLMAFQIIWPQLEDEEIKIFEFQLLFSYQLQLPNQQVDGSLINAHVLEHSKGVIALCYEIQNSVIVNSTSTYAYCIHLINSKNIIECRTPSYVTDPPGRILFTMYKSYITVITKHFVHLIDIYCHAKQICSYIWPTSFNTDQFLDLKSLSEIKLANMYFLQGTRLVLSMKPNLYSIAKMIKDCHSVTQKVGAVNFIVYNHLWKGKEKATEAAIEYVMFSIKNSFTISRLMEEYITASVNRYLRIKVTQERIMKIIDNTTLTGQFTSKVQSIIGPADFIIDNDLIIVNLQSVGDDALVIFANDNLPNPQINRFIRLSSDYGHWATNPLKIELVFENNVYPDDADLPSYLTGISLSENETRTLDTFILQKLNNLGKFDSINSQSFIEKIRICTIRAWKRLLFLMHRTVFNDDNTLWNDLSNFRRTNDYKIKCFHGALGAFRYLLLKEKLSVPASVEEIYVLTSYSILSDQRFLLYLTYSDFMSITTISLDFFKEFYKRLSSTTDNKILVQIKERIIAKMSIDSKMEVLSILNKSDQDHVTKEYWESINRQTNVFNKYYGEILTNVSRSCGTPQNALEQFYKESMDKINLNE